MADLEQTIKVLFAGDASGFSGTLSSVTSGLSGLDGKIQSIAAPVADVTTKLLLFEAGLAAAGAALVVLAVDTAGDFKDGMKELGALFNANGEQVSDLSGRILEFGKTSTSSYTDIQKAAFLAISTGTDQAQVTDTLAAAQKLATVGSTDLNTATSALARSLNAYGADASQATSYGEALFLAAQQGDTNFTDLGGSIGKVAATASASKVPFSDLLAAVAGVTIAGVSTDETMTKLKALLLELSVPSKELSQALGGVSLETDGLQKVMQVLKDKTGGTTAGLSELFKSSEALAAATILSNDSAGKFNSTLELMATRAGVVDQNYKQMAEGNKNLGNVITATLVAIGEPLDDSMDRITNAVAGIFEAIGASVTDGKLGELEGGIKTLMDNIGAGIEGIAAALPDALNLLDFSGLMESFSGLGDEFSKVFDSIFGAGLDLTKPEDLAIALQKAINIMTTLVNVTTGIIDQFQPIFDILGEAATEVSNTDSTVAESIGNFMGAMTLIADFGTALGGLVVLLGETNADVSAVWDLMAGGVTIFANVLDNGFLTIRLAIAGLLSNFYEAKSALTFGDASTQAAADAQRWTDTATKLAGDIATNSTDISKAWDRMWGDSSASTDKAVESVKTAGAKIVTEYAGFTGDAADVLKSFDDDVANGGLEGTTEVFGFAKDKAEDFVAKCEELEAAGVQFSSTWDESGGKITTTAEEIGTATAAMFAFDIGDGKSQLEDLTGAFKFGKDSVGDYQAKVKELEKLGFKFLKDWSADTGGVIKVLDDVATSTDKAATANQGLEKASGKAKDELKAQEKAANELAAAQKKAAEEARQLEIKLLEMASNERIKTWELKASINKTQIEADARTVSAAFESIGKSVVSTQETVSDLYKLFADPKTSGFDKLAIQEAAAEAAKNAKQALENQTKLNDAQVRKLDAQVESLKKGGLITIKGEGMEPVLKDVLRSFAEMLQIEASAAGLEFITGGV